MIEVRRTATQPWDAADHLETEEDMVAYLDAALEEFDLGLIAAALGDIARAKGMTRTWRQMRDWEGRVSTSLCRSKATPRSTPCSK